MKRIVLSILLATSYFFAFAQTGYQINITLKPYKDTFIYLGYYYGNKKGLADSVLLNGNSFGVFQGKKTLPGGIYFIVSPQKEILFELLLDKDQHFSIVADTADLPASVKFANSMENSLFKDYTLFANQAGKLIGNISREYSSAKNAKDSAAVSAKLKALGDKLQHYRDSVTEKHPASILSSLFTAMKEPIVPSVSKHPGGKYDSNFAYTYFKSHYWDNISLTDGRLIRTPFFEHKLDKYFHDLVPPNPDSVTREVDMMLLQARTDKEMFQYLMVYFVQKFVNPEYMGQDAVFVHLFEKYINAGQAEFFTKQYREFMDRRAYSLMANLIGHPAANLNMVDTLDKPMPLYNVKSDLVVVCFWDPTCGHCKEVVPKVDSFYRTKWKQQGVTIYGVMVDGGKENWINFIKDNNLKDWIHVYQLPSQQEEDNKAGRPSYRQLYDVYQTPILYLLDKDKRIVAKKLTQEQLNEVIDMKLKTSKSN